MKRGVVVFSFVVFLLAGVNAPAQMDKKIEVVGDSLPSTDVFFIAENHGIYEGDQLEVELIELLNEKFQIQHVVLECSKSLAYLLNCYAQQGDTTIYLLDKKINVLAKKYKKLYEEHKIIVHGMDFERGEFITAIKLLLKKNDYGRKTELYKYVSSFPDTIENFIPRGISGYEKRTDIYRATQNIFELEKDSLKKDLGDDYNIVAEILENPVTEREMKKRDETMAVNLSALKGQKFVCITGAGHTTLHSGNSLLSRFIHDNTNLK